MPWYHVLACLFAGAFLANGVPHFVQGVSGERFPSPFAKPPGRGLSSPTVNVVWGLFNFAGGGVLAHAGQLWSRGLLGGALLLAGAAAISIPSSKGFANKEPK